MKKLNKPIEVEAIDAGAVFGTGGYAKAASRKPDIGWRHALQRFRPRVAAQRAHRRGRDGLRFVANLLQSLRGRLDWRGHPLKRAKAVLKYLVRAIGMPLQHGRYLELIYGHPRMHAYVCRDPRLLERHFHRYMHAQWSRRERLQSLHRHYQFALTRLPRGLFEQIYVHGNATLGTLNLKDGSGLKLCLRPPIFLGCEGELCIQLSDAADHPLYRIVLSVAGDLPTITIGCIQGPGGENAKDIVRELTRNMHGLRPKQLMLFLVYAFARHYAIEHICAVGNAVHPLRSSRRQFQADYDAFWVEQQGRDAGDGWFLLPEALQRKCEAEISSHHRSAFRRREALRVAAEQLLIDALAAFSSHRATRLPEQAAAPFASFQHGDREAWCTA